MRPTLTREHPVADGLLHDLASDLGVTPGDVAFLGEVEGDVLATLHEALRRAHARQERALAEAFEGTITLIPRPLRGRVRKLLLGG